MYRWVEHTGELEVEIEAENEAAVFEQGFEAMRDLLRDGVEETQSATETKRISLSAPDRGALLADWLSELAFLAEAEGFLPDRLDAIELGGDGLVAELIGSRGDAPHLVKAATYHRLAFERRASGWHARIVLDV